MDRSVASEEETETKQTPQKRSSSQEKSSLWGAGEIIEGKRAKKTVERLDLKDTKKTPIKLKIGEGRGEKLGDIPRTCHQLMKIKPADLKPLHSILFERPGKLSLIKKNIRQFNGFSFDADSEQFTKKRDKLLKNSHFTNTKLKVVCRVLDLEKKGTHSDLVDRIMAFLLSPKSSGKRLAKKKKKTKKNLSRGDSTTKTKKKRSSKQKPSSSSLSPKKSKTGSKSKAIVMDSSSDEDEEDEEKTAASAESDESEAEEKQEKDEQQSSDKSEQSDDEEEEEESPKPKARGKAASKKSAPVKRQRTPVKKNGPPKKRRKNEVSDESESESSSSNKEEEDDKPKKKKAAAAKPAAKTKKADSSSNRKNTTNNTTAEDSSDEDEPLIKMIKKTPSDEQLRETVQSLLKEANLEEMTMKQICQRVFETYSGQDLSSKKDFIKQTVKSLIT